MKLISGHVDIANLYSRACIPFYKEEDHYQLADKVLTKLKQKDYEIYAIDFDGTVTNPGGWPNIGFPNWKMIYAVRNMQAQGHKFILWTNRQDSCPQCPDGLKRAVEFCEFYEITPDAVNDNIPEILRIFDGYNPRKITADYYIDDKSPGSIEWFCNRFGN